MTAIRPPEYFPRPSYFALIDAADQFVLGDTLQYSRQSYQNRAPLRTPDGRQWISVPLKGGQHGAPICDARIRQVPHWSRRHWRSLHYNYRTAPFFDFYAPELKWIFEREWTQLGALTCTTVVVLCEVMGIETPLHRAATLPGRPSGVREIFDVVEAGGLLTARETAPADSRFAPLIGLLDAGRLTYRQNFEGFEPEMSVLDLLFNYGPETMPMIRRAAVIAAPT